MKKMIQSSSESYEPQIINITAVIDFSYNETIAATTFNGKELPVGDLLPSDKDAVINSQALEDYHSFVETVEDLLDYYGLEVYYRNEYIK